MIFSIKREVWLSSLPLSSIFQLVCYWLWTIHYLAEWKLNRVHQQNQTKANSSFYWVCLIRGGHSVVFFIKYYKELQQQNKTLQIPANCLNESARVGSMRQWAHLKEMLLASAAAPALFHWHFTMQTAAAGRKYVFVNAVRITYGWIQAQVSRS